MRGKPRGFGFLKNLRGRPRENPVEFGCYEKNVSGRPLEIPVEFGCYEKVLEENFLIARSCEKPKHSDSYKTFIQTNVQNSRIHIAKRNQISEKLSNELDQT